METIQFHEFFFTEFTNLFILKSRKTSDNIKKRLMDTHTLPVMIYRRNMESLAVAHGKMKHR